MQAPIRMTELSTEIGWRLAWESWGQVFATEAARECLRFAFESLAPCSIAAGATSGSAVPKR